MATGGRQVRQVRTIDAHVGGAPLRLVVEGFPAPEGRTLAERAAWAERYADGVRLALLREPRGHADLLGAVLVEPVSPQASAGILFMDGAGFGGFRGHDLVAAVTVALQRGLLVPRAAEAIVIDTVAGPIEVRPMAAATAGDLPPDAPVAYRPPPCAVVAAALPIKVSGRRLRVDVAWAAGWYVIADREALGVPSGWGTLETLRRAALSTLEVLEPQSRRWRAPGPAPSSGVVLTGPPARDDADLRSTTVYADGTVDRSPSGSGTCAVLAVLDAMGLAAPGRLVRHEGPSGLVFEARVAGRVTLDDHAAIVAEVSGSAWITGEHRFLLDRADPLVEGFLPAL